jgi:hypothetical protein
LQRSKNSTNAGRHVFRFAQRQSLRTRFRSRSTAAPGSS